MDNELSVAFSEFRITIYVRIEFLQALLDVLAVTSYVGYAIGSKVPIEWLEVKSRIEINHFVIVCTSYT